MAGSSCTLSPCPFLPRPPISTKSPHTVIGRSLAFSSYAAKQRFSYFYTQRFTLVTGDKNDMKKVINTVRSREIGTGFFGWPSCYFLLSQTDRRTGRVSSYCRPGWLGNIANIKPRQQRGASRLRLSSIAWPEPYRMSEWVTSAHTLLSFSLSPSPYFLSDLMANVLPQSPS
jgi:hypothetical protein